MVFLFLVLLFSSFSSSFCFLGVICSFSSSFSSLSSFNFFFFFFLFFSFFFFIFFFFFFSSLRKRKKGKKIRKSGWVGCGFSPSHLTPAANPPATPRVSPPPYLVGRTISTW